MKVQATVFRALRQAAIDYGVDLALLIAICVQESGLDPLAVGDLETGVSLGLGQLSLRGAGAAWRSNPGPLLRPEVNAVVAAAYLRTCLNAYPDDEARAISAYNQGITGAGAGRWWQVNGEQYIEPVQGLLSRFRTEGLEETWDNNVPEGLREYGKTLLDVAITLKGVCDDVLAKLRRSVARANETVAESGGL